MACNARLAMMFKKTLQDAPNGICSLKDFPCSVRRYFLGVSCTNGYEFNFAIHSVPTQLLACLLYREGVRFFYVDETWFGNGFSDESEICRVMEAARKAIKENRFFWAIPRWG